MLKMTNVFIFEKFQPQEALRGSAPGFYYFEFFFDYITVWARPEFFTVIMVPRIVFPFEGFPILGPWAPSVGSFFFYM